MKTKPEPFPTTVAGMRQLITEMTAAAGERPKRMQVPEGTCEALANDMNPLLRFSADSEEIILSEHDGADGVFMGVALYEVAV